MYPLEQNIYFKGRKLLEGFDSMWKQSWRHNRLPFCTNDSAKHWGDPFTMELCKLIKNKNTSSWEATLQCIIFFSICNSNELSGKKICSPLSKIFVKGRLHFGNLYSLGQQALRHKKVFFVKMAKNTKVCIDVFTRKCSDSLVGVGRLLADGKSSTLRHPKFSWMFELKSQGKVKHSKAK